MRKRKKSRVEFKHREEEIGEEGGRKRWKDSENVNGKTEIRNGVGQNLF